jgi:hypothetical protein
MQASGIRRGRRLACYGPRVNSLFRVLLAIWVVLYLVIACAPVLSNSVFVGGIGFVSGIILLVPWLVGAVILGCLIWLTNPQRRR